MRTISDLFSDPRLFTTTVVAIMIDRFGADCVNWEQETLEMEVRGLSANFDKDLMDKLSAGFVILSEDSPHQDTMIFNNVTQVLNFDDIDPEAFIPATLEDILWGCSEMRLLEGAEEYDSIGFSPDIKSYVGTLLVQHGLTTPPSVLSFADISEKDLTSRDDGLGADSLMFEAYWDEQRSTKEDMEKFVIGRTNDLLFQLSTVPFKNSDPAFLKNVKELLA